MTIRLRMGLWYAAILFISLTLLGAFDYHEILEERRFLQHRHDRPADNDEDDAGLDLIQIALSCGLPAAVLGLAGGWWLMRRALAPVARLTRAVETLQENNLRQQLPRTGNQDEIDRLLQVFNAMTARLEESFQRVREFTLHASHELKTPVTILHAELETALASPGLSANHRDLLEGQLDELQRLAKIIDGLTLLTKADAGLISLHLEPVRLDELVRDAVEDARILAHDSSLAVTLDCCEETVVRGDRHRLRQLLLNLTDNAVKYCRASGQITLALREAGGFAEITVSNSGPGLSPELACRVFDRFFRGDASHHRSLDGCGLGLSISQWIARAHEGRITFDTRLEGPTVVQVVLPLAARPRQPRPDPVLLSAAPAVALLGLAFALSLTGCARFTPEPLSPSRTAAEIEGRTLDTPPFRTFLETNLHRRLEPWPIRSWGFEELNLAALYYHPSLDVARAEWRVARAGRQTASARPNPTLTATPGYDFNSTGLSPWLPLIFVDLPLETAGKRGFRTAQAVHLSESARWSIATAAWRVRANLRSALLDYSAARRRADILLEEQAVQEKIVLSLRRQLEAGAVSSSELTLVRIALDKSLLDLNDAREQAADARVRVAGAIGVPAKALEGVELAFDFDPPGAAAAELMSAGVREQALQNRPDILGALAAYAASQSALQLEIAKQYPDIHLGPGYQFDHGEHTFTLDLTAELPVLNQNQGPIAEAGARRSAEAARFLALQAEVITAADRAAAVYQVARERLATIESLAASQNKQTEVVRAQQSAGASSSLDLLNARVELAAAQLLQLDGRVKLQQAYAALEDAVQRPLAAIQPGLIEQSQRPSAPKNRLP